MVYAANLLHILVGSRGGGGVRQTEYIQFPKCLEKVREEEGGGVPPAAVRHVSQNFSRFGTEEAGGISALLDTKLYK